MPTNNESDEQVREKLASELAQWVNPAVTNPWVVADFILAREQKLRVAMEKIQNGGANNNCMICGLVGEHESNCIVGQALSTHNTTEDGR